MLEDLLIDLHSDAVVPAQLNVGKPECDYDETECGACTSAEVYE